MRAKHPPFDFSVSDAVVMAKASFLGPNVVKSEEDMDIVLEALRETGTVESANRSLETGNANARVLPGSWPDCGRSALG